jgi:hypothetical protein
MCIVDAIIAATHRVGKSAALGPGRSAQSTTLGEAYTRGVHVHAPATACDDPAALELPILAEETLMQIDGGCHCGNIKYEAQVDPETVGVCHCTDCQVLSGSAYSISVPARREAFRLLSGEPKIYVKTADSGAQRAQAFCPQCGTRIYATAANAPRIFNIRLGTVRQRAELPPKLQHWCRSALPWVMELGSVAQIAGQADR